VTAIRQHGQTLLDVAIQYCGSAEAVFEIAVLNDIQLTDMERMKLKMPAAYNTKIVDYYRNNNISPATELAGTRRIITHTGEQIITHNQNNLVQHG
jgi:hypothetical protein